MLPPPSRRHVCICSLQSLHATTAACYEGQVIISGPASISAVVPPSHNLAPGCAGVLYGIADVPAWWMCILLGFQTYLTMLGASVLIPLILVPAMGGTTADLAEVICTCFFSSGINTLLQTLLGARLPIVQVSQPALAAAVDTGSTRLETPQYVTVLRLFHSCCRRGRRCRCAS